MSKLKDLLAQQAEISKQIEELRHAERSGAIITVRLLIAEHELNQDDLFGKSDTIKKVKTVSKVEPKYQDPISGNKWSGRGVQPKWITDSGKDKSTFLIKKIE